MHTPITSHDNNKVSIIGCGKVGMTTAYTIFLSGIANEIVLHGRCIDTIIGEQLDLEHALSFVGETKIKATEDYADIADSDVVIIAAGAAQKPGETRLDLAAKNIAITGDIIDNVKKYAPNAIVLMVTNPVDVLTYKAYLKAEWPKGRIFGSGTVLDTSRFRFHLSKSLKVNPKSIHAYILGEHGNSSFPVTGHATVGGQLLANFPGYSAERMHEAYEAAKNAAYKIIESKGATYYAIAVAASHIVTAILRDSKSVLPVSIPLHGQYGHSGVALSVPCIVGRNGVEHILETQLTPQEQKQLDESVEILKSYL